MCWPHMESPKKMWSTLGQQKAAGHFCCKPSTRSSSSQSHPQNYHCHFDHWYNITIMYNPHAPSSLPSCPSSSSPPSSSSFIPIFPFQSSPRPSHHLIQPSLGWQRCSQHGTMVEDMAGGTVVSGSGGNPKEEKGKPQWKGNPHEIPWLYPHEIPWLYQGLPGWWSVSKIKLQMIRDVGVSKISYCFTSTWGKIENLEYHIDWY